jgi:hypothetical protein
MHHKLMGMLLALTALTALSSIAGRIQAVSSGRVIEPQAASAGEWTTIERPAPFGKDRDKRYREYDERYGAGNWRLVWEIAGNAVGRDGVVMLYEDAYYVFLQKNPGVLKQLITEASDVYDDAPSNVQSGFDYAKQETDRTHLQDISIRRCVLRLGQKFQGRELIQIRDTQGKHPLSLTLSPGQVPFHLPELIKQPEQKGWWKPGSVESFYQSNRVLQVKGKR